MSRPFLFNSIQRRPIFTLVTAFVAWKLLIFSIAAFGKERGYDTSTLFLLPSSAPTGVESILDSFTVQSIARKLARWDAVYFIAAAERGYVYEQEWAFGWGFTKAIEAIAYFMPLSLPTTMRMALAGVAIANTCHLLSVITLFVLCRVLLGSSANNISALIPACLHIISPAGAFLSAPYGESLYSLLNFAGYLCYARSFVATRSFFKRTLLDDVALLASGIFWGAACLVRSNGLFNGSILAYDLVTSLPQATRLLSHFSGFRYMSSIVAAGLLIAAGFALPQYLAYVDFCTGFGEAREWCNKLPPSIYLFVQKHYWNVGFLRYWTLPNLPLFALAAPTLNVLAASSFWAFHAHTAIAPPSASRKNPQHLLAGIEVPFLLRMAMPQTILAVLALTNFHVQAIIRIASGYPLGYIWIAEQLRVTPLESDNLLFASPKWVLRWMVIYGLVQCGLFANFLPPA